MHQLVISLQRAMEPPPIKRRPLIWRSTPKSQKLKSIALALEPTEEEMQYLTFFTDYCKQEDFTAYRAQFPDDFDLTFQNKRSESVGNIEVTEDQRKERDSNIS